MEEEQVLQTNSHPTQEEASDVQIPRQEDVKALVVAPLFEKMQEMKQK